MPKCDRITVVADSEYMGEKIPFCTDAKKKTEEKSTEEDSKANKKFSYKTSYPNVDLLEFLKFLYYLCQTFDKRAQQKAPAGFPAGAKEVTRPLGESNGLRHCQK